MSISVDLTSSAIKKDAKVSLIGKILLGLTGGVAAGLTIICASFVSPAFRKFCLPYIPATKKQIENVFLALESRSGSLVDLGSGDGRIVLEAAKRNFISHGIELNFWLVLYSKLDAFYKGLNEKARFYRKDLWNVNLRDYDNVVIFGVEQMMEELGKKIEKECKNGCTVVACRFPLPNKSPVMTFGCGVDTVWLYTVRKI